MGQDAMTLDGWTQRDARFWDTITPSELQKQIQDSALEPKTLWKALIRRWHPDTHPDDPQTAARVLAKILTLKSTWNRATPQTKSLSPHTFTTAEGNTLVIKAVRWTKADLGDMGTTPKAFVQIVEKANADLAERERQARNLWTFANDSMKTEMSRFLHAPTEATALDDGRVCLQTPRPAGSVLLRDVLEHTGPLAPEHVAWIVSGLMNLCAWLSFARLVHGGLSLDSVAIAPKTHDVHLVAGWCFAGRQGTRHDVLPGFTLDTTPHLCSGGERRCDTDLNAVRAIGRTLLGDPAGDTLKNHPTRPHTAKWLLFPTRAKTGMEDYKTWQKALNADWTQRRFATFPATAREILL